MYLQITIAYEHFNSINAFFKNPHLRKLIVFTLSFSGTPPIYTSVIYRSSTKKDHEEEMKDLSKGTASNEVLEKI